MEEIILKRLEGRDVKFTGKLLGSLIDPEISEIIKNESGEAQPKELSLYQTDDNEYVLYIHYDSTTEPDIKVGLLNEVFEVYKQVNISNPALMKALFKASNVDFEMSLKEFKQEQFSDEFVPF